MSILFLDTETRGRVDIDVGPFRYADSADLLIVTYAIDSGPVQLVATGAALSWDDIPSALRKRLEDPETTIVCWNSQFDRAILNHALPGGPYLPVERFRDAMVRAMATGLPRKLKDACKALGVPGKLDGGDDLIELFCQPDSAPPDTESEAWQRFCAYAKQDITAMCRVWAVTPDLRLEDWQMFWASERINERGVGFDREFVESAVALAAKDRARSNLRVTRLTSGVITSIFQHVALAEWLGERLADDPEAIDILTVALIEPEQENGDESEELERYPKLSLKRANVTRLIAYLEQRDPPPDPTVLAVLKLREFGATTVPKKFEKILAMASGGRLRGQFLFHGAHTGRWSGRGVQLQNLSRTPLGGDYGIHEEPSIAAIMNGCSLDELEAIGDGEVPSRKLSLLIRPAFIARTGSTLVKADYSQVEARALPWLANSRGAAKLLDYFRATDADPTMPDLYTTTAAAMLGRDPAGITKAERQNGKVATLACGYGGGIGAILSMGMNYGVYLSEDEARELVGLWRQANAWAPAFWGRHDRNDSFGLWGAMSRAYYEPGVAHAAGRVAYFFEPRLYGGTMVCRLPSGRLIYYPHFARREHQIKEKLTGLVKDVRVTFSYRHQTGGYRMLWAGLLAENVTQGACADLLREAIVGLEMDGERVVLHSHDEVVCETAAPTDTIANMRQAMLYDRPWIKDLPLAVDVTERWYYSAAKLKEKLIYA